MSSSGALTSNQPDPLIDLTTLAAPEESPVQYDIKELAELSGHTVRNLRAYLQLGLLQAGTKQGRSLFFNPGHVRRLQQIDRFRDRGYSLAAIQDIVSGKGDAVIASDIAAMTNLIKRWVTDDDHQWTWPEIERLFPEIIDHPELLDHVYETGIGRIVDDGLIITRPELFRLGYDLTQRGMPLAEALGELQRLNELLSPVLDYLLAIYRDQIEPNEQESDADRLASLWPTVMMSISSQLTREMFRVLGDEA